MPSLTVTSASLLGDLHSPPLQDNNSHHCSCEDAHISEENAHLNACQKQCKNWCIFRCTSLKNGFTLISMEHNIASVCVLLYISRKKKSPLFVKMCIFCKANIFLRKRNDQTLKCECELKFIYCRRNNTTN